MSNTIAIAAAVTAALVTAGYAEAERIYRATFDLTDMDVRHISVMPSELGIAPMDRNATQDDTTIDVAIQKRISAAPNSAAAMTEIDDLMTTAEEIGDLFRLVELAGHTTAKWIGTAFAPMFIPEQLNRIHQFTSVVQLTFRERRAKV